MKRILYFAYATLTSIAICSCSNNDDPAKDLEKPQIVDGDIPSPINCEVYHKGETIPFHHSHSTSAGDCPLDPIKTPVNPWIYNQGFAIPTGATSYEAKVDIPIPYDIDNGDYHFMVRVTDKAGWQQLKAISIKIAD